MTLPPVIRVFFAIDLPAPVKQTLGAFINGLKKQSKSHAIRWSKPENLHITLQFLAEVQSEHVDSLVKNVRVEVAGVVKHLPIQLGALRLFPNPYKPRVIVLDLTAQEGLAALAEAVGSGVVATHYQIEDRPFRGHLTLGRIKHIKKANLHFLSEVEIPAMDSMDVQEVVLFRSEPSPEGSRYSVLERIKLLE